jgi:Protein of unknown function (DUF2442)
MNISAVEIVVPNAETVTVSDDTLTVDLSDGRTLAVPLAWFPRLVHAIQKERNNGDSLRKVKAFTGKTSTRTLASKVCLLVDHLAKASDHSRIGSAAVLAP